MKRWWEILAALGRGLWRPLRWLALLLAWPFTTFGRLIHWLATALYHLREARRQARLPEQTRRRRRRRSRASILKARLRVLFLRPSPPAGASLAAGQTLSPRRRLPLLTVTAVASVALLSSAALLNRFSLFPVETPTAVAQLPSETPRPSDTPTPLPTATPTLTPSPTPTATPATIYLTPLPTPNPLLGGGSIAFVMNKEGNRDIYVLSIGRDEPVRLTDSPAEDRDPAWRPDGREIAFASRRDGNWELYVLDLPTGDLFRITDNPGFDGNPAWSPDGQWLVYEAYRENNLDIYIIKRDGSEGPIRLTRDPAPDYAPVWSPDGRHIAFTSLRSGNQDIFLVSLDDVRDEAAVNLTQSPDRQEDDPAFHPKGAFLAYRESSAGIDLIVARRLHNMVPEGEPITLGQGRHPTWSPSGDNLAYAHSQVDTHYLIASSIDAWAVAPQTFASRGQIDSPAWSGITFAQKPAGYLADIGGRPSPPLYTETISQTTQVDPPYLVIQVDVEAPLPFFSDRVEQSFLALRQRVAADAGWDALAILEEAFVPIDALPLPNETTRSWHKAGRAFDLSSESALTFNPQIEVIPEFTGGGIYWRVYLRAAVQDGSLGEPLRRHSWDFRARYGDDPRYYDQGGKPKERVPAGYYVDLTALAADYGWERVAAGENWKTYYPAVRYWQFVKREGLSWEAAMREIYPSAEVAARFGE